MKRYFLLFLCIVIPLHAHTRTPHKRFDDALFDFEDENVNLQAQFECSEDDIIGILELLIDDLDALCILQQSLYKRTNELNQRNLLDYGIFLPQKFYARPWQMGAHVFYNQTTRDNFTRKSTAICSYLAIFNPTLLDALQERIEQLTDLPFQLREALPLFANATIQERRGGFMLHGMRRWSQYRFRWMFPLYYLESNLFLTPEEIDLIQQEFGITDPADDLTFARENLIADSCGIGDLRLNFDMPLQGSGIATKIGIQATIPTAFAFKKGLYGTEFKKRCRGPQLNFCQLFKLATEGDFEDLQEIGQTFASMALEQFNANLIQQPMGNGGHFGLGVYVRTKTPLSTVIKRPWAEHITMRSRISAEYLFPKTRKRYFIQANTKEQFTKLGLNRSTAIIIEEIQNDPAYAQEVLNFLQTQLSDKIFPFAIPTKVRPGIIFRWMTKYIYETDLDWGYFIGTDTWITTRERLGDMHIPEGIPCDLNKNIAQKPFGYQVGFMGNLFWKRPTGWLLSLNAEYNFTSTGIGSDFLFSFNFEKSF